MSSGRHPRGLYVLFLAEMWERFSFYGMKALLILYLHDYLRWAQEDASKVFKWYTSLVFLTPIIGGYLADHHLGNKRAVTIGAVLMAFGHFIMAVESQAALYTALALLIVGNGFFKPNISTQVGRLYPKNDARLDGAYTIFYMGINLGAFLSPLVCGWLAEKYSFSWGFAAAGVGMLFGLATYLAGMRFVVEVDARAPSKDLDTSTNGDGSRPRALSEEAASLTPSAAPALNRLAPSVARAAGYGLAGFVTLAAAARWAGWDIGGWIATDNLVSLGIASACALTAAAILLRVSNGARDRVLAIYLLALFVIFFWSAFEQAGNAMTLWADKHTVRHVTQGEPPQSIYPIADADSLAVPLVRGAWSSWLSLWNPVPTAWFQAINALSLVLLAPFFSMLWTWLDRRGKNPSTPTKMAAGLVFMALGFALMVAAAALEDRPTSVPATELPGAIALNEKDQICERGENGELRPFHAGRLRLDRSAGLFRLQGVLPDTERDRIAGAAAPADFVKKLDELAAKSRSAPGDPFQVSVQLGAEPPGFDMRFTGIEPAKLSYDKSAMTLSSTVRMAERETKALLLAAAEPRFRDAVNGLYVESSRHKVSAWWLFWFYICSTLGELCLSPIGLAMVSKLAPARFATMLMGLWLLTNFAGNFVAGAMGEVWGSVAPVPYFAALVAALGAAALVLFICVRRIVAMMHGAA